MIDMTKYGRKYVCFSCGCKFYDMNKPDPFCPKCGSSQKDAPDINDKKTALTPLPPVDEESGDDQLLELEEDFEYLDEEENFSVEEQD
jgi:hypothetical protein